MDHVGGVRDAAVAYCHGAGADTIDLDFEPLSVFADDDFLHITHVSENGGERGLELQ